MPTDPPKRRYSLTREHMQTLDALVQQAGIGLLLHMLSHACSKLAEKSPSKMEPGPTARAR